MKVALELVRGAVAECGVSSVEVEVSIEVVGYFQSRLFEADKHADMGQ